MAVALTPPTRSTVLPVPAPGRARARRRPPSLPPVAVARRPRPRDGARTGAVAMERELVAAPPPVDAARAPRCSERPQFHLAPPHGGWVNDPNAPIVDKDGRIHLFYQHLVEGCTWDFGIVWGHAVSDDLVTWRHLPPALAPTPGGPDADGCFSGCAAVDGAGTIHLLYTGVRLRSNADAGPPPPPEHDLALPFIEAQLAAVPVDPASDPLLTRWRKLDAPVLPLPPPNAGLVGWRDPFVFEAPGVNGATEWAMLLGSGFKGRGGAALIYRAPSLTSGWRYEGTMCEYDNADTGAMWECPLIARLKVREEGGTAAAAAPPVASNIAPFTPRGGSPSATSTVTPADAAADAVAALSLDGAGDRGASSTLPPANAAATHDHFFCVSPDAPTNPVLYWVGAFDAAATRFDVASASGPHRLDLGDILYAPNLMTCPAGRTVLWGWLQERRGVGQYEYAGCMAVPRVLTRTATGRLHQEPVPEVAALRVGASWAADRVVLEPDVATPVETVASPRLDLSVTLARGAASAAGILVRSWAAGGEGSAAIVVDWEAGVLEAVFEGGGDDGAPTAQRRIGGPVDLGPPGALVHMRLLLDHSACEVYLGSGEVLSTRVYRGTPPPGADAGVDLVAYGGAAIAMRVEAHEMGTSAAGVVPGKAAAGARVTAEPPRGAPAPTYAPAAAAVPTSG